ncbi:MAG: hypothetical protein IT341_04075 [Chloroflexi bacterium]|nr:hypothetical protein [Chloroflexota bacterium]
MHSRRLVALVLLCATTTVTSVAPVAAATPRTPPASHVPMTTGERPLTPAELARSAAKIRAANEFVAHFEATGLGLRSLGCVPNITPQAPRSDTVANTVTSAAALTRRIVAGSCAPPSGFLQVEARQQIFDHYCGPAAGQVISNYSWAMRAGKDKYTQGNIAGWMGTDVNGQTSAFGLAEGLEQATVRSPRRPVTFGWTVTELDDLDGDGTTGDELHNYLMSAISGTKMPIAVALKPHEPDSSDFLASWPKAIRSNGHWIAAYGWYETWGPRARMYYADSSANQGGGTGKYWDPTAEIARLIDAHTKRFVW